MIVKEFTWGWMVWHDETCILEHRFKPGIIIDVPLLMEAKAYREELIGDHNYYSLSETRSGLDATTEAKALSVDPDYLHNIQARAIVVDQLAERLIVNFYLRVNRPPVETKVFSIKEEAISWLISLNRINK